MTAARALAARWWDLIKSAHPGDRTRVERIISAEIVQVDIHGAEETAHERVDDYCMGCGGDGEVSTGRAGDPHAGVKPCELCGGETR